MKTVALNLLIVMTLVAAPISMGGHPQGEVSASESANAITVSGASDAGSVVYAIDVPTAQTVHYELEHFIRLRQSEGEPEFGFNVLVGSASFDLNMDVFQVDPDGIVRPSAWNHLYQFLPGTNHWYAFSGEYGGMSVQPEPNAGDSSRFRMLGGPSPPTGKIELDAGRYYWIFGATFGQEFTASIQGDGLAVTSHLNGSAIRAVHSDGDFSETFRASINGPIGPHVGATSRSTFSFRLDEPGFVFVKVYSADGDTVDITSPSGKDMTLIQKSHGGKAVRIGPVGALVAPVHSRQMDVVSAESGQWTVTVSESRSYHDIHVVVLPLPPSKT
ncbi:MAG: hypothetical protein KY455_02750 [Euryarchaeota archaeon]|nr:hypothetical protein [Euryarchaeota archaeon]